MDDKSRSWHDTIWRDASFDHEGLRVNELFRIAMDLFLYDDDSGFVILLNPHDQCQRLRKCGRVIDGWRLDRSCSHCAG
ncbi:hypothetical protein IP87_21355 [beta proteobacterium AAP121]|nr:hypothetical protein IP80_21180 [beta proteobacterium AAP65]KPF90324.1 hypothetical protein IP87_21355 [beta proteobacterium AAP121]